MRAKKSYVSPFILKANQVAKERSKNALKVLRSTKGKGASSKGEWNERIYNSESGLFDPSIKKVEIFKIEPKVVPNSAPTRYNSSTPTANNNDNYNARLTRKTQSEYISSRPRSSRSTNVKFLNSDDDDDNNIDSYGPGDLSTEDDVDCFEFDDEVDYTTAGELSPESDSPHSTLQRFRRMVTRSTSPIDERIVRALMLDEEGAASQAEAASSSTGAVANLEADLGDADDEGGDDVEEDLDTSLVDKIAPYQSPGPTPAVRGLGGGSTRDVLLESFMRMLDVMTGVMAGDGSRGKRTSSRESNSPPVLLSQNRILPRASLGEQDSEESEESSGYDESTFEQHEDASSAPPATDSGNNDKMISLILEKLESVEKTEGRLMEMLSRNNSSSDNKNDTSSSGKAPAGRTAEYSSVHVTRTPRVPAVHVAPLVSDRLHSDKIDELSSRYSQKTGDLMKYTKPSSGSAEQAAGFNLRAPLAFRTFETSLNTAPSPSSRSMQQQKREHEITKMKLTEELKKGLYIDNSDSAGDFKKKIDGANKLYSVRDRKMLDRISFLPRVSLAYEKHDAIIEHKVACERERELKEFVVRTRTGQTLAHLGDVIAAKVSRSSLYFFFLYTLHYLFSQQIQIFEECVDEVGDQVEEFLSDYAERFIDKI